MKQAFLLFVGGFVVVALLGGVVYLFARAIMTLFQDHIAGKESEQIAADAEQRRAERAKRNAERLDNGCEHQWGGLISAFPDHACQKCGLEKLPPVGPCDHTWRLQMDNVPYAACEKCGKRYVRRQNAFH